MSAAYRDRGAERISSGDPIWVTRPSSTRTRRSHERRSLDGVVRHDDPYAREPCELATDELTDPHPGAHVERRQGLVQQQQRRLGDQSPRERDPLCFAAREVTWSSLGASANAEATQEVGCSLTGL